MSDESVIFRHSFLKSARRNIVFVLQVCSLQSKPKARTAITRESKQKFSKSFVVCFTWVKWAGSELFIATVNEGENTGWEV